MRKVAIKNGECYHIFNRGVDKRQVFNGIADYERFLLSFILMNDEKDGLMIRWRNFKASNKDTPLKEFLRLNLSEKNKLVDIVAYCLNPNHFHLILKQLRDKGIERFMQKISTGYTMYFNEKNKRSGALFQGRFKSTHIGENALLLHLSVYVNCNSEIHGISDAEKYPWCSFSNYIGAKEDEIMEINKALVMGQFASVDDYKTFCRSNVPYFKEKKDDEKLYME